jgi:integrase
MAIEIDKLVVTLDADIADYTNKLTANAVTVWFHRFYAGLGWERFSSHSGRRTFATNVARNIIQAGGSLKDLQTLLGHADLSTTAKYIEASEDAQKRVVDMI